MPAVPFIPAIIGAGVSGYSAYKNSKAAGQARGMQNSLVQRGATNLDRATTAGAGVLNTSLPAFQNGLNYFQQILGGNRAKMAQATAGTTARITDTYRGAESGINRGMAAGPERTLAMKELARDRAGALAGVITGQQGNAAQTLASFGQTGIGQGLNTMTTAASGYAGLAEPYGQMGTEYQKMAGDDMAGIGRSIGELFKIWSQRRGGGK